MDHPGWDLSPGLRVRTSNNGFVLFFFSKKLDNYYYKYFKDALNPLDSFSLNLELHFPSFLVKLRN